MHAILELRLQAELQAARSLLDAGQTCSWPGDPAQRNAPPGPPPKAELAARSPYRSCSASLSGRTGRPRPSRAAERGWPSVAMVKTADRAMLKQLLLKRSAQKGARPVSAFEQKVLMVSSSPTRLPSSRFSHMTAASRKPICCPQMILAVPAGKVTTYGELARALGSSSRAVGQALRRNPFAPEVPCHRIVRASLDIGGYSGSQVRLLPLLLASEPFS